MSGWFALLGVLVGSVLTAAGYEWTRRPRRLVRRGQTMFAPCPWCPDPADCQGHYR